jgi:hypothetical protein
MRNGKTPRPRTGREREAEITLQDIIPYLQGVKRVNGYYIACCPAHDDRHPSLTLREEGGRLLWHCHAGCSQARVLEAFRELLGRTHTHTRPRTQAQRPEPAEPEPDTEAAGVTLAEYAHAKGLDAERLQAWGCTEIQRHGKPCLQIPYRDDSGEVRAIRYRIGLNGARFLWRTGDKPLPFGLWRLNEWREGGEVYLCEGETDTFTLWHAGLPAIGVPGASAWQPEWWRYLRDFRRVLVIPDNDAAGKEMVRKLNDTCPVEIDSSVEVLALPADVKDANELWQREGCNAEAFTETLNDCPRVPLPISIPTSFTLDALEIGEFEHETADVLVPNLLYKGRITLLVGDPGVGKTTFALEMADTLEQGGTLWGKVEVPQTRILWLDFDHRITRLREIMEAYYGERHRRNILCLRPEQLCPLSPETLPAYIELIRREGIELIIADTAFDWLSVIEDSAEPEAREKIALLRKLVNYTGVGVLLLHHTNKKEGTVSTRSLLGSQAWGAKVDVVAFLTPAANEDTDAVILRVEKDRDGEKRRMHFERRERRFIPVDPVPRSDWGIVKEYLLQHGEATYEELLAVLTEAGYRMTYEALRARVKRWREKGLIHKQRKGFPPQTVITLKCVQIGHSPSPHDEGVTNDRYDRNDRYESETETESESQPFDSKRSFRSFVTPFPPPSESARNGEGDTANGLPECERTQAEQQGAESSPDGLPSAPRAIEDPPAVLEGEALVQAILDTFGGREPTESCEACLEWLEESARSGKLTPAGANTARQCLLLARDSGYRRLAFPYNGEIHTIEAGERAWLQAIVEMVGTPCCAHALLALQRLANAQRAKPQRRGRKPLRDGSQCLLLDLLN